MPKFLDSLPMILSRSLDRVMPSYRRLFQANDQTDQQWWVLRALWEQKHLTSSEISQITLLPPPSLAGILDRLEKKNLIGRLRSTKDRRHVNIIPTQKGRVLMEHMMPMVDRIHNDFMQRVTTAEWAEFNRILDKLSEPTEKRNLT
ncbi:MarR family transcriptional regulator [Planktomarina sp.]|uniref:MarR family winged helix-turn-helix transcriptional regulator n=1 Tax=Planktomarina sp. TaxID=2024851 RepID=UPI00288C91AB|nr:MarR family transcriptional regulator [Planktomarina sp.]